MSNQIVINKMSATTPIFDVVAPASTVNGHLLVLGALGTDGTYTVAAPAAVTDKGMVMVLDVPLSYEAEKTEDDYVIATGQVVRGYAPYVGMVVSIPVANITATAVLAADKNVVPKAGAAKMECVDALGGTDEVIFIIESLLTKASVSMAKLRCIKAY
jgi:hypothetical protein